MTTLLSTERLARASARRPRLVLAVWGLLFLMGGILAAGVGGVLTTEQRFLNEPESARAERLLEERLRGPRTPMEFVIVQSPTSTVDDAEYRAVVDGLLAEIRGLTGAVGFATSFYESGDPSLVSADRRTTLLPVALQGEFGDAHATVAPLVELVHRANGRAGFRVLVGGEGSINHTFNDTAERDLRTAELFGLPVALVILVLVFGAVVAAGVPLLLAFVAITVAVGITALIGRLFTLSFFVVNMITMIGLAVGIDYALFIVGRFREERRRGLSPADAVARAGATASRAVLFSGVTVVVALLGMLAVTFNIFVSLVIGAVTVVIVAVLAALTLLPAVLRLLGDRVDALRLPSFTCKRVGEQRRGFWERVARLVMAHPWRSVLAATALLLVAAAPYAGIRTGTNGLDMLPRDTDAYQAFEFLREEFSVGLLAPMDVVVAAPDVNAPAVQQGIGRLREQLAADPIFGPPTVTANEAGDLALLSVPANAAPTSREALDALARLRQVYVPAAFDGTEVTVAVGGETALNQDGFDLIDTATPVVFVAVLGLSFLLLLVAFRSLVVPAKAILMNLLSVGAAYGLVVLVFQHGIGNELLGVQRTPTVDAWIPLFMFSVLFGLSMDYHVFLLSRIRERYDQTGDNAGAVAFGLQSTAGIITGAALIMVTVFAGFAGGQLVMFQQVGFGLAVAIILDATIVRTVLVPATMQLLGTRNWYLPRWLEWLPAITVEGGEPVTGALLADELTADNHHAPAGSGRTPEQHAWVDTAVAVPSRG